MAHFVSYFYTLYVYGQAKLPLIIFIINTFAAVAFTFRSVVPVVGYY